MHTKEQWRVGDAGFTIFGPPNGQPAPEVIANVKRKDNATGIVADHNALVGLNPGAIKGLVEAAEFAYDACFDGSPIDNESVKQRLERALKNLKGE